MNSFSNDPTKRFRNKPKRRANPQAMAGRPQNKPKPKPKDDPFGRNMQRGLGNQGQNQQVDYSGQQDLTRRSKTAPTRETLHPRKLREMQETKRFHAMPEEWSPGMDFYEFARQGAERRKGRTFTDMLDQYGSTYARGPDDPPSINLQAMADRPAFGQPAANVSAMAARPEFTYNQGVNRNAMIDRPDMPPVANPDAMAARPNMPAVANPAAMAARPDVASVVPPIANPAAMAARPDVASVIPPVANAAAMAARPDMPGSASVLPVEDPFGRNIRAIEPASAMDSPLQMQAEANRKALNAGLTDPYGRGIQALEPQDGGFGGSPLQIAELQRAAGARDIQDENARIEAQQAQLTQQIQATEPPATALGPYTQGATPEPPAVDPFRAQLQQAIQGRLGADPYAARQAAAEADYQVQADKAREALSERLNRLGVLRGGGATASQFGEFESGVLRGQQALGAQYEGQRQAGIEKAIEQGIGMYEAGGRQDISREQQRMQEIEMFGGEAGPEGRGTLARRLGVGGMDLQTAQLEEQRQARLQRGTEGELERELSREELYGGVTRPVDRASTLAARESTAQRGLQERELTQRGTLAEAEIESREGLAREDRLLGREELYGTGDIAAQQGSTLASRELAQRGDIAAEQSRLEEVNLYGRTLSDAERSMIAAGRGGPSTVAARDLTQRGGQFDRELAAREKESGLQRDLTREEMYGGPQGMVDQRAGTLAAQEARSSRQLQREDLALRGELGRGQLGLAQTELYGQDVSGMSPMQIQALGGTLGAREAREGRALEERRLDEVELAGREGRALAQTEMYGQDVSGMSPMQIQALGGTLAAREGAAERLSREGMAAADITSREGIATSGRELAREELYGTGDVTQHMGDTLASRVSTREQADRATALGYEGRRVREQEQSGRETRDIQRREQQYREDQRSIDNALLALGVMQTGSGIEGYKVSEEESALVKSLLGPYAQGGGPQVLDQTGRIGTEEEGVRITNNTGVSQFNDDIYRHPDDPEIGRFAGLETATQDDLAAQLATPYIGEDQSGRMTAAQIRQRRGMLFRAPPNPTPRNANSYNLTYTGGN